MGAGALGKGGSGGGASAGSCPSGIWMRGMSDSTRSEEDGIALFF